MVFKFKLYVYKSKVSGVSGTLINLKILEKGAAFKHKEKHNMFL